MSEFALPERVRRDGRCRGPGRRTPVLRRLRAAARTDDPAAPDLVDHPVAVLEGAGPYLPRHCRVVTFDGRGSGGSVRPVGAAAYADAEYAEDTLAVLDATDTERAVLVALSCAGAWACTSPRTTPTGCSGLVALGPACGFAIPARRDDTGGATATTPPQGGRSTTSGTGSRATTTTSCGSSSPSCSPSRTRPSRSRTAWPGRTRSPRDAGRHHAGRSGWTARCAAVETSASGSCPVRSSTAPTITSARTRTGSGWPSSPAARCSPSRAPAT